MHYLHTSASKKLRSTFSNSCLKLSLLRERDLLQSVMLIRLTVKATKRHNCLFVCSFSVNIDCVVSSVSY